MMVMILMHLDDDPRGLFVVAIINEMEMYQVYIEIVWFYLKDYF